MNRYSAQNDHAAILETVNRFVDREVVPNVAVLEREHRFPDHLVQSMASLGLFGMVVPEEHGGLGLSFELIAAITEALASGWTTLAAYLNSHTTVCHVIARHGTFDQKQRHLPGLAMGQPRAALCLTEPQAGSDLSAIRTRAERTGNDFKITGNKMFVTNGRRAGKLLVLAISGTDSSPGENEFSLFLVAKESSGVVVGNDFAKMAYGQVDTCEITFDGVAVGADELIGSKPGRGMAQLLDGLDVGRIEIAASAIGLGQAALNHSIRYARDRVAFGRPIAEHQAVRHELASMATRLEAARALTRMAARHKTANGRADKLCSMAKLFASEAGMDVATSALRIHGGYGYIKDFAIERLFREAPLYLVGEGTNEIQKLVIARRLLDDKG